LAVVGKKLNNLFYFYFLKMSALSTQQDASNTMALLERLILCNVRLITYLSKKGLFPALCDNANPSRGVWLMYTAATPLLPRLRVLERAAEHRTLRGPEVLVVMQELVKPFFVQEAQWNGFSSNSLNADNLALFRQLSQNYNPLTHAIFIVEIAFGLPSENNVLQKIMLMEFTRGGERESAEDAFRSLPPPPITTLGSWVPLELRKSPLVRVKDTLMQNYPELYVQFASMDITSADPSQIKEKMEDMVKIIRARKNCSACGVVVEKRNRCSQCKMVIYCGATCQLAHWREHKNHCSLLADQYELFTDVADRDM
jgi:hypothetical protein